MTDICWLILRGVSSAGAALVFIGCGLLLKIVDMVTCVGQAVILSMPVASNYLAELVLILKVYQLDSESLVEWRQFLHNLQSFTCLTGPVTQAYY
ncbi:MAG: hypothetical protein IME93_04590 [Proteobacteria bacterium]|nr:hypothetical protein [Pseudomonadota bacterium]